MRTAEASLDEYERKWGRIREILEQDGHLVHDLAGALTLVNNKFLGARAMLKSSPAAAASASSSAAVLFGRPVPMPLSVKPRISDAVFQDLYLAALQRHAPDAQAIVELGSGWGRRLFAMLMDTRGCGIDYFALDITRNGLAVADRLAKYEPAERVHTCRFDFAEPFKTHLSLPRNDTVFVYTSNAIEQLPSMDRAVFDFILSLGKRVVCAHLEPVGWQFPEPASDIDEPLRNYCLANGYNRNFAELYRERLAAGSICAKDFAKHVWGNNDPATATSGGSVVSLVVWEKAA